MMPIEKIITRTLAGLSVVSFILALTYSPAYTVVSATFVMLFIVIDILLPKEPRSSEKQWEKVLMKVMTILLIIGVLGSITCTVIIWKMRHFARLGS